MRTDHRHVPDYRWTVGASAKDYPLTAHYGGEAVTAQLDSYPTAPEWDDEDGEGDAWELTGRR